MAGLVTLTGGTFQDAMGNLLSDGYLICELSQDEQLSSSQGQAVGGRKIKVLLGTDGNVLASPAQKVWPTDEMNPGNASYTVWGYTEEGQLVWGPNYGLLVPTGSTYNVDGWVPNQIGGSGSGGGGAPVGSLLLQTNGVNNGSQQLLNLVEGENVTITDDGAGDITIAANSGGQKGPRPAFGAWHYWNAYAGVESSSLVSSPLVNLQTAGALTVQPPSSTEPVLAETAAVAAVFQQEAGINETFALVGGGVAPISIPLLVDWQARVLTPLATSAGDRYWLGMANYPITTPIASGVMAGDGPALGFAIGFRYSPGTDTNWVAYVGDTASNVEQDTGVTPDTAASHTFEIQVNGGNALFYIDNALVATLSLAPVSGATPFYSVIAADTEFNAANNVAASVLLAWLYWESSV